MSPVSRGLMARNRKTAALPIHGINQPERKVLAHVPRINPYTVMKDISNEFRLLWYFDKQSSNLFRKKVILFSQLLIDSILVTDIYFHSACSSSSFTNNF